MDYHIDHEGYDGQWRVWWLRPDGYTAFKEFADRAAAQRWLDYITALEAMQ